MFGIKMGGRRKKLTTIFVAGCALYFVYKLFFNGRLIENKSKHDNPLSYIRHQRGFKVSDIRELDLLGKINVPLRKALMAWESDTNDTYSDLAKDFQLSGTDSLKSFTKTDRRRIVQKYISNEESFRNKDNFGKLMLLANRIQKGQESTGLGWDQFKEILTSQNFAGPRFLFQNGKDALMKLEQLTAMSKAVHLTESDIKVLKNVQPGIGKRRNNRKQLHFHKEKILAPWQMLHNGITQYELYRDLGLVDKVIHDLRAKKIIQLVLRADGTQTKFTLIFEDGSKALFKPKRFPFTQETLPDEMYFNDYERHTSEIASFFLDRVLGLHHAPPVVGRKLSISDDIIPYLSDETKRTFFESPSGNICFFAACDYYCDQAHAICGHPDTIDGSAGFYLPSSVLIERSEWANPWKRTYNRRSKAKWQINATYCDTVRKMPLYKDERRLLDLMDMTIFDFFLGNPDRHHFETITRFDNDTTPLYLDHGRGFGRPFYDEMSILKPVTQCCLIRYTTLKTLVKFNDGPMKLSDAMRHAMADDILSPVLTDQMFLALDRRVKIILKEITNCIHKTGDEKKVVIHIA